MTWIITISMGWVVTLVLLGGILGYTLGINRKELR